MKNSDQTTFHPSHEKRIDVYIQKAQPFAAPILRHLRALVHQACPEVEETIKWGMPHFVYQGEILCSMAAFKKHCAFIFWKASLMTDPVLQENAIGKTAMGHLGKITSIADLPPDEKMKAYLLEAMELNEKGIKIPQRSAHEKQELTVPDDLKEALERNSKALDTFEQFSYSNRKDYIEWITDAKTNATREKRLKAAVEWMAEGKPRNWKYMKEWKGHP